MKRHMRGLFFGAMVLTLAFALHADDCCRQIMECLQIAQSESREEKASLTVLVRGMMKSRSGAT